MCICVCLCVSVSVVRSLASAVRHLVDPKFSSHHPTPHFNFYTLDFNNDRLAINGGLMWNAITFAKQSLHRIIQHYPMETKVLIVAHSMGGLVARRLVLYPDIAKSVQMVLTLATPHVDPVVVFDAKAAHIYHAITHCTTTSDHHHHHPDVRMDNNVGRDVVDNHTPPPPGDYVGVGGWRSSR